MYNFWFVEPLILWLSSDFKIFMKFNYFYKRSLKPGVGNLIINKVEVLISSSVWTWMFTRIQTCPRLRIRARAITKISREWHQSKNDKVIVKLKEYFVEQCLSSYVHCYAHVRMVQLENNWAICDNFLCSESFDEGVLEVRHLAFQSGSKIRFWH